jgi:hypothetical protein
MLFSITACSNTWTEEDLAFGEPSGRESEDLEPMSFRDLVDFLRNHNVSEASNYPVSLGDKFWINISPETDIISGDQTEVSLHLKNQDKRALRYWYKAFQASK